MPSVSGKQCCAEKHLADYPEKEGYRIASVKIDKKEIDLEKYQSKYTLKSVQGAHTISIVYEKKLANVEDHTACLCRSGTFVSGLCLYLRVLQIRRIRRRKLEAENAAERESNGTTTSGISTKFIEFSEQFIKKELFFCLML